MDIKECKRPSHWLNLTLCRKRSTATMCRSHRWLTMKPAKPKIAIVDEPAPSIEVKPEKEKKKKKKKQQPQQPQKQSEVRATIAATSSIKDELDVTKDNLRLFVERWREHPDSPYQLEMDNGHSSKWEDREGLSVHGDNANLELTSLRGHSPSPCGSICSSSLSEVSCSPADKSNYSLAVPNAMVLGLERRASEGYAKTGCRRDQAAQIVLAEEIIKLSEHLRTLAMGQSGTQNLERVDEAGKKFLETNVTNGAQREKNEKCSNKAVARGWEKMDIESNGDERNSTTSFVRLSTNKKTSSSDQLTNNCSKRNEISEKLSSITRARKINGTTFNGTRSYDKQDEYVTSFNLKKTSSSSSAPRSDENSLTGESTSFAIPERDIINSSRVTWKLDRDKNHADEVDETCRDSKIDGSLLNDREIDLSPPWRRARIKHRFGETCRDVPRISNLRDIHKSLNLDEPKSTKDLLLHLLGEWDDNTRPGGGLGRKSISVDWCSEESVARRSMNSLAEYFQSEQQKTATTGMSSNAT